MFERCVRTEATLVCLMLPAGSCMHVFEVCVWSGPVRKCSVLCLKRGVHASGAFVQKVTNERTKCWSWNRVVHVFGLSVRTTVSSMCSVMCSQIGLMQPYCFVRYSCCQFSDHRLFCSII